MDYKKQHNFDIEAHIANKLIHGGTGTGSSLPAGNDFEVIRRDTDNNVEFTDIIKLNDDGAEATVDHADGTLPRMVNLVYVAVGGALVDADTVPVGTFGAIHAA